MAKSRTRVGAAVLDPTPPPRMRTLARYFSPQKAHLVRGLLEDEGVPCVLNNELFSAVDGPVAVATGGIAVQVRESDLARAVGILKAQEQEAGEEPASRRAKRSPQAWLAVLLVVSLLGSCLLSVAENVMSLMRSR